MRYRFYICDVFTDRRFGGNQLAVLPDAEGLWDAQMQQIAREFNFPESTFVFRPERGGTRKVRIFTPRFELPFAGHPNVGTAFTLATIGELGSFDTALSIVFEEQAGLVPLDIHRRGVGIWCELAAPERLSLGNEIDASLIATAVSLSPSDIVQVTHAPRPASVGLAFVMAEVTDRAALGRARVNMAGFDALEAQGVRPHIHLYVRSQDAFDLRTRMFAPHAGVPEDPATGSANCALAGMLAHYDARSSGGLEWRIAQGVEMGRPSVLDARAEKSDGVVSRTWIGGTSVMVADGFIDVD